MASPTKRYIAEQVQYKLSGGFPDVSQPVQLEDIYAALGNLINSTYKLQHFTMTLPSGETIPNNLALATYETDVVSFGGKKSKALLPVMPISLPRNIGVYEVAADEYFTSPYIPIQAGQANLLSGQPLISTLLGQVGYEIYGNAIITTEDVTIDGTITKLYVRLIVMDVTEYDEDTPLPIPSDMIADIVDQLFKQFMPSEMVGDDKLVDSFTNSKQPPQ